MVTTVYTDGACLGNPGPGGWAWAVPDGAYASGAEPHTTNQRMEIVAALEALRAIEGPTEVVSDSTYVVNCFRQRWWETWLAKGWLNSRRQPVANRDLWEPLVELVRRRDVTFRWVKGHASDPMNDLVDRLAVAAARAQAGQEGVGRPADLGPPDVPGERGAAARADLDAQPAAVAPKKKEKKEKKDDPRAPDGHRLVVAGLRPPALGGYEANPVADRVRERLTQIFAATKELHPDLYVLTGLGLGAEQLGAEAAAAAKVRYVAVLPYPEPEAMWPEATRLRFRELRDGADDVILLQTRVPESKGAAGGSLGRRDEWLARHAHQAVVVWDHRDLLVGRLVQSLLGHVGEEDVWIVDPTEG